MQENKNRRKKNNKNEMNSNIKIRIKKKKEKQKQKQKQKEKKKTCNQYLAANYFCKNFHHIYIWLIFKCVYDIKDLL